jgi:hypothetical protein
MKHRAVVATFIMFTGIPAGHQTAQCVLTLSRYCLLQLQVLLACLSGSAQAAASGAVQEAGAGGSGSTP